MSKLNQKLSNISIHRDYVQKPVEGKRKAAELYRVTIGDVVEMKIMGSGIGTSIREIDVVKMVNSLQKNHIGYVTEG